MPNSVKIHRFPNGLTIKKLKEIIKDWPETHENGEATEVWRESSEGLSSQIIEVCPLNLRKNSADIILQ